MVERRMACVDHSGVPGLSQQKLSKAGERRLAAAERAITKAEGDLSAARQAWAETVRELGISAVARSLGVTPAAISERIKVIERRR